MNTKKKPTRSKPEKRKGSPGNAIKKVSTGKTRKNPSDRPASEPNRDFWAKARWVFPFMAGVVVPTVAAQVFDFGQLPFGWQTAFWIVIFLVVAVSLFSYARRLRWRLLIFSIAVVLSTWMIVQSSVTSTHRHVNEVVQEICNDGMWAQPPACYEESIEHVASEFEAFDPDSWHGWSEVGEVHTVPIAEIPRTIHTLIGSSFATVGTVLAVQPSGTLIIQLEQPSEEALSRIDETAARRLLGDGYEDVLTASVSGTTPNARAYCALPPRPFFVPSKGDVLAVTAAPVAFGIVPQQDSTATNQAVYLLCSSAERLTN